MNPFVSREGWRLRYETVLDVSGAEADRLLAEADELMKLDRRLTEETARAEVERRWLVIVNHGARPAGIIGL